MFLVLIVTILAVLSSRFLVKKFFYWKRRGIPQMSLMQIAKLNCTLITRSKSGHDLINDIYRLYQNISYVGEYQFLNPFLMLHNPDLIKQIFVKDFDHFVDHKLLIQDTKDPVWSLNLISLKGQKWRDVRATLSPAFTSSKMKFMFVSISQCAERFVDYFVENIKDTKEVLVKDAFSRYSNDVIASCAFGISCDSMKDKNNEFYKMGRELTNFSSFWGGLRFALRAFFPNLISFLGIRLFSSEATKYFSDIIKETVKVREKEGLVGLDMIHLLMEARKGKLKHDEHSDGKNENSFAAVEESEVGKSGRRVEITDELLIAQALIFFFAGFETVSTAASFMAYELAVNPDIQKKLHEEIKSALKENDGRVTYESLLKMKYLDMVVSETLRKWPPLALAERVCVKPYTIKVQGKDEKDAILKEGDSVMVPIMGIHRDEKYYPNPEKFDPKRFNDENKHKIDPYFYLPFGSGPRGCIGSRFALLEIKTVFFHLLRKFELVVVEKTPIPMKLAKNFVNLDAESGLFLGLKLRD